MDFDSIEGAQKGMYLIKSHKMTMQRFVPVLNCFFVLHFSMKYRFDFYTSTAFSRLRNVLILQSIFTLHLLLCRGGMNLSNFGASLETWKIFTGTVARDISIPSYYSVGVK